MTNFTLEKLDEVKDGVLSFYKIVKDGKCFYDEFCLEIGQNSIEHKQLNVIRAYMNLLAERNNQLPLKKFNSIKDKQKVIEYEFKSEKLRVYVVKKDPNIFVVIGGHKITQNKDVSIFKNIISLIDFDQLEASINSLSTDKLETK